MGRSAVCACLSPSVGTREEPDPGRDCRRDRQRRVGHGGWEDAGDDQTMHRSALTTVTVKLASM
ncbi:hypothetical protein [Dactylosporangium sp. NPDC000521]|uniref:hypothetical protein n=1 Tax=Dactylosporangium sp. NPDC000521 TaxID=3363975 RepID=UPI0036CA165D